MKRKIFSILFALVLVLSLSLIPSASVGASPGPGLVGLWHFDEGIGPTASDSSGNGNIGTLMGGASWTTSGKFGNALDFDGINDYVAVGFSGSLDFTAAGQDFSAEAWINLDQFKDFNLVFQQENGGSFDGRAWLYVRANGAVESFIGGSATVTATGLITTGDWHHVALTFDKDVGSQTGTLKIYVDGVQRASSTRTFEPSTGDYRIGIHKLNLHPLDGLIDEVRIWDVAVKPGIVGLWHLDEGSGTDAYDSSGYGNNGTVNGDPTYVSDQWSGQALNFDGDSDYVSIPDATQLDISGNICVEAWVKISSLTNNRFFTIVGKWNDVGVDNRAYLLGITTKVSPTEARFYISDDGRNFDSVSSSQAILLGIWYHIVGRFDGDILSICVNGTEDTYDTSITAIDTNSEPVLIAGNKAGYNKNAYFNGVIDEVRIWDTANPVFNLDASPDEGFNLVDTQHTITATVEISKVSGGTTPAPGETVNFEVISGPNASDSGSPTTNSNGVATFTYTSSGEAGTDTIRAWIDQDWSGDFDSDNDAWDEVTKDWVVGDIEVDIDIKPGSFPNSINPKSKGVIPVAILGSDTFDVTTVDVSSLQFGPSNATPAHDLTISDVYADHLQDVNNDGFTDLVSHYRTQETGIVKGDTSATLTGQTTGGTPITGTDSIRIVGK